MGAVLWRLQSGIERTLEATDLSSPNTRGFTQGRTARQSYRKADFGLPEGSAHWASWHPSHPGVETVVAVVFLQGMLALATRFPRRFSEQVTVRQDPERIPSRGQAAQVPPRFLPL